MSDLDLLELKLADGTPVVVETTVAGAGADLRRVSRGDTGGGKVDRRFEEAVANIRPAAQVLLDSLHELNTPDEINLEFGLKFNAKVGAIFASVDSEAVFKVAIKVEKGEQGTQPFSCRFRTLVPFGSNICVGGSRRPSVRATAHDPGEQHPTARTRCASP